MNNMFKLTALLLCPVLSLLADSSTDNCNWPSVNHDHKNTRSSPCTTVTFEDLQAGLVVLHWSAPGGAVQAAPVVQDGVVYYGDFDSTDGHGTIYARDITNGNLLHSVSFPPGEAPQGPQTIANGILYATTVSPAPLPYGGLRLYAFDLNLVPVPGFNGGLPVDIDPGKTGVDGNVLSGPVVIDNRVIVGTTNATSQETVVLFPTYRGGFQSFDATTGALNWRMQVSPASSGFGTGSGSFSTPSFDPELGLMFVGTSNATSPPASPYTDSLLAIDYATGEIVWSQQFTEDDVYSVQYGCGPDLDVGGSPNLFRVHGKKAVGVGSKAGVYRVFRRDNGRKIWHGHIIPKDAVPSIDGAPGAAFANDHVYAVSNEDTSGISSNCFNIAASIAASLGDFAPLFTVQLVNFTQNDYTHITAFDADKGKTKWTNSHVSATVASLTEANGVIYTGNFLGQFRGLDAETGAEVLIATMPANLPIGAPITVVGNQFFIGYDIGNPGGLIVYHKP